MKAEKHLLQCTVYNVQYLTTVNLKQSPYLVIVMMGGGSVTTTATATAAATTTTNKHKVCLRVLCILVLRFPETLKPTPYR
jgi:hypothetical protein